MIGKKKGFIVITIFVTLACVGGVIFFSDNGQREVYAGYDSIGGKKVTIENFHAFFNKIPKDIEKKVRQWFATHPNAYEVLVKQDGFLGCMHKKLRAAKKFFSVHQDIKHTSAFNYIFRVPKESFFLKISGANNRFINSVYNMGLGCRFSYSRTMFGKGKKESEAKLVGFDKDKRAIMNCFAWCCSQDLLKKRPTRAQVRTLIALVAGAFSKLGYIVESILIDTFLTPETFKPKTIEGAFKALVDYTFFRLKDLCYDNDLLMVTKSLDTYQTASRFFHQQRFNEAIALFNLDALEYAPETYVINISSDYRRRLSCSDKYVVLVQKKIPDYYKPLDFYTNASKDVLDAIFSRDTFFQLLKAFEYAGCYDINGENIYINSKTKKITYIDFEQYVFTKEGELFNKTEGMRRRNLYALFTGFFKQFKVSSRQVYYLHSFIQKKWPGFYTYKETRGVHAFIKNLSLGSFHEEDCDTKKAISYILLYAHKDAKLCMRLKKYIQNTLIKAGKEVL